MSTVRLVAVFGVAFAAALVAAAAAAFGAGPGRHEPGAIELTMRWSHYQPAQVTVPAGVPVTFVLHNGDPIDHEWIVGDAAVHERHRTGTEPYHASRPTEVSIGAGETVRTTVTFATQGTLTYVCHLPGHEAYGMVGTLVVTGP
jgi:uncharacterized cupredoxin-like copper-binding protein